MKNNTLLILFFLCACSICAQDTFDLDWEQGVNGADASFTIDIGDTVRWTWANGSPHSVTSLAGSTETFDSGIITGMGTQFEFTFNQAGSNDYQCDVHASTMFGTITVETLSAEDKFAKNIKFYPNPVADNMTIASLYQFDTYEIFDMNGKKVGWGVGEGTYTQLNVSYLTSGMYFVRVSMDDRVATIPLIKK